MFSSSLEHVATAQKEFTQIYPELGWVEHDPEELWSTALGTAKEALDGNGHLFSGIGVTNQRETAIIWDRETGNPIHNAIVWQDRRTAELTNTLRRDGLEPEINERTGLLLDPYFSASKVAWILDNVTGARARAEAGHLAFGTVDSFLIWRLTGGRQHVSDISNAARTSLFNIRTKEWDSELLRIFNIPEQVLPTVLENVSDFGVSEASILGAAIKIGGAAGDQQAAAIGQACYAPGTVKSTYGTGCFVLVNTGEKPIFSKNKLLTTIAYSVGGNCVYALEGSIFMAGATMQWLRDSLGLIANAAESEMIARKLNHRHGVYLVPAFVGLAAPHWDPEAKGAIHGLTRGAGAAEIVRAGLESSAYQTHDLLECFRDDGISLTELRIDGGMVANTWFNQFLADIVRIPVRVPNNAETTALGAAILAAINVGVLDSLDGFSKQWRELHSYDSTMSLDVRQSLLAGWDNAVRRVIG